MGVAGKIRLATGVLTALVIFALAGCDDPDAPYLEFAGGGFEVNYRNGTTLYGFLVRPMRTLERGTVLEAVFEDPAGGTPFKVSKTVAEPQLTYVFKSPEVRGLVKGKPVTAVIRVLAASDGKQLARYERQFTPTLSDAELPHLPLAPGPDYAPNAELFEGGTLKRLPER